MAEAWSKVEVERVVADYFGMLRLELLGKPYSKTEHRRRLMPGLDGRRDQSIEFKHANISAVLVEMQLPYIDGYKPRGNYQKLLRQPAIEPCPSVSSGAGALLLAVPGAHSAKV